LPSNTRLQFPSERTPELGQTPKKTAAEASHKKRVWKAYEFRLDFQEQCAM